MLFVFVFVSSASLDKYKNDRAEQSGSQHVSQRDKDLKEECESQTLINFVLKLAEARLFRPFVGPTQEHTVSLFFR